METIYKILVLALSGFWEFLGILILTSAWLAIPTAIIAAGLEAIKSKPNKP